jgi:hypothetical protein
MPRIEEEREKWLRFAVHKAERNNELKTNLHFLSHRVEPSVSIPEVTCKNYIQRVEVAYAKKQVKATEKFLIHFLKNRNYQELLQNSDVAYTLSQPHMRKLWIDAGLNEQDVVLLVKNVHKILILGIAKGCLHIASANLKKIEDDIHRLAEKNEQLSRYLSVFCREETDFEQFSFWYANKVLWCAMNAKFQVPIEHNHDKSLQTVIEIFSYVLVQYWLYSVLPYYINVDVDLQIELHVTVRDGFDLISYYLHGGKDTQLGKINKALVSHVLKNVLRLKVSNNQYHRHFESNAFETKTNDILYGLSDHLRGPLIECPWQIALVNCEQLDACRGKFSNFLTTDAHEYLIKFFSRWDGQIHRLPSLGELIESGCNWFGKREVDMWDFYFAQKILKQKITPRPTSADLIALHRKGFHFKELPPPDDPKLVQHLIAQFFVSSDIPKSVLEKKAEELGFGWCGLGSAIPKGIPALITKSANKNELFSFIVKQGLTKQLAEVLSVRGNAPSSKNIFKLFRAIKSNYPTVWKEILLAH